MAVNRDFKDLFSTLNVFHVRFLVVGAHAVIHYTEPRYTKDLDIWVEPAARNAKATWRALTQFGAPLRGVSETDFKDPEIIFQIGVAPNRVDIMPGVPGVRFKTAWRNALKTTYGGTPIRIIGFNDLLRAKRAAARPQDLLDLAALDATKKARRQ
jgi:hypothetical protein